MVSILLEFPLSNSLRPPVRLSWIKNMNMKKSRLWLSLLILSYIQTIFFKSCMSFIASCSSPAMLNLFLKAFKLCPHSLMLMYSGKWCRVSLGICWERIKNMNMKKSRLWLSLLILSYIQTIFFKSCMSFIASCSSPAMLNLFLKAFKLCPHSLMLMYSGKWCRVSLGICWENSPLSSNWLFLFKIFGLTLFELQIRQCFASFLPTSQFSSTFQVSGLFVLLDFFDLFFDLYDIFEFSVIVGFSGIIRLSCFPFLSIFLEMQKLLFHNPHLLTVLCQ